MLGQWGRSETPERLGSSPNTVYITNPRKGMFVVSGGGPGWRRVSLLGSRSVGKENGSLFPSPRHLDWVATPRHFYGTSPVGRNPGRSRRYSRGFQKKKKKDQNKTKMLRRTRPHT